MNANKIIFTILFLTFLTIPLASALSISGLYNSAKNVVKNVYNGIKNLFTGGSSSSSSTTTGNNKDSGKTGSDNKIGSGSSGSGSSGSGSSGATYYPWGEGNIPDPIVTTKPSYQTPMQKALYHNVDLGEATLTCINCPLQRPDVAGFDYKLNIELVNKGNYRAEGVNLAIEVVYPDGQKQNYKFEKTRALTIEAGAYDFEFVLPSIGVDPDTSDIKDYAMRAGSTSQFPVNVKVTLTNDKGVDRYETVGVVTPRQECKWVSNGIFSWKYVCTEIEPLKEVKTIPFEVPADDKLNILQKQYLLNKLSSELYGGGKLNGF